MVRIDGLTQALKYGGTSERLYVKFLSHGKDGTQKQGIAPTVTIYDPSGTAIATAQTLTRYGSTSWWYVDLDISTTATWDKGTMYRAVATFTDQTTSRTKDEEDWFDVALRPLNEPVITSEEIDAENPTWSAMRPSAWEDWTAAIYSAHRTLHAHIRGLKDEDGDLIYPFMVMNEAQLKEVSLALAERFIISKIPRLAESLEEATKREINAIAKLSPLMIDRDSDRVVDDDELEGFLIPDCRLTR